MNKLKTLRTLARSGHPDAPKARQLLEMLAEERTFIGVFGTFSSGKSTVVDALLGHYLVPTKVTPNTAHTIFVQNGRPGLTIIYKNGERRHIPLSGGLLRKAPAQEVIEQTASRELGNAYEKDAVDYYLLSYHAPFLGDKAALVDTPGTNSVIDGHDLTAMEAMDALDIAVYVINAQQPFSEIDAKSIRYIGERYDEVIILVNKIDRFDHGEQRLEDFLEDIRGQIKTKGGLKSFYLYPVSAKAQLREGGGDKHNAFAEFKERLSFLVKRRAEAILQHKVEARIDREIPDLEAMVAQLEPVQEPSRLPYAVLGCGLLTLLLAGMLVPIVWGVRSFVRADQPTRWRWVGPATMAGVYERLNARSQYQAEVEALRSYVKDGKARNDTMLLLQARVALAIIDGKSEQATMLLSERAVKRRLDPVSFFNLKVMTRSFGTADLESWRVELFIVIAGLIVLLILTNLLRRLLRLPRWISRTFAMFALIYAGALVYFFYMNRGPPMPPDFHARIWLAAAALSYLSLLTKRIA